MKPPESPATSIKSLLAHLIWDREGAPPTRSSLRDPVASIFIGAPAGPHDLLRPHPRARAGCSAPPPLLPCLDPGWIESSTTPWPRRQAAPTRRSSSPRLLPVSCCSSPTAAANRVVALFLLQGQSTTETKNVPGHRCRRRPNLLLSLLPLSNERCTTPAPP